MIVSHKHKFIFIKTAKTAGTSIEIALSKICGTKDIITPLPPKFEKIREDLGFPGAQNYSVPLEFMSIRDILSTIKNLRVPRFYAHTDAKRARKYLSQDNWNNYFKFCFVRNPWDRYLSYYHWNGGKEKYGSIKNFMKSEKASNLLSTQMYCENDKIIVDKIFKYEELEVAFNEINKILQLSPDQSVSLQDIKVNTSSRTKKESVRQSLDKTEVDFITELYKEEI